MITVDLPELGAALYELTSDMILGVKLEFCKTIAVQSPTSLGQKTLLL